jgi:nucleotide-binding universal stress UspA family protein
MAKTKAFCVLVATDGSAQARAAVGTTARFPWPTGARVRVVSAGRARAEYRRSILLTALDRGAERAVEGARRVLSRRWPDVETVVVDKAPVEAVLDEASRCRADAIVMGWRGHGVARRLLMGSVSRGVVRGARSAVLVVRGRAHDVRHILVALDGSATDRRALAFVARLAPPHGGRATLFSAVEQMELPSSGMIPPAIRAEVAGEVRSANTRRVTSTAKALNRAAAELKRRGWRTRVVITLGAPLHDLLATAESTHADLVVIGARGVSGVRRLLLGSVAEGFLNRWPKSALVVR